MKGYGTPSALERTLRRLISRHSPKAKTGRLVSKTYRKRSTGRYVPKKTKTSQRKYVTLRNRLPSNVVQKIARYTSGGRKFKRR